MTSGPDFKVTTFFEVEFQKDIKDKVTTAQEESTRNGTMFGDLD